MNTCTSNRWTKNRARTYASFNRHRLTNLTLLSEAECMHSDEPRNLTFRRRSRIQKRKRRCPHIGQRQRSCT